jgi:hypothetical protein
MTDKSKLMLSAEELQLVGNAGWILTKRTIIDKVNFLFGGLAAAMQEQVLAKKQYLPAAAIASTAKIAKGESYLHLPYVILDYPRCFDKENIFAVRTMFWWGNFFSCTLHLSGGYKTLFEQALQNNISILQQNNFYLCINEDEWQHHFDADNYVPANTLTAQKAVSIILQQRFIKVSAKFSLQQWNEMEELLENCFSTVLQLLKP